VEPPSTDDLRPWGALLTNCYSEETKGDTDPADPTFSPPKWQTQAVAAGSRHPREARIMAISRVFSSPVNLVNGFP